MATPFDVTVIVPAYEASKWLAETLSTVAKQSERCAELIVVDDGSMDNTGEVVESFARTYADVPVRLLRQPHYGAGAARNAGVRAASSVWVAFLDSDDLWHPEKLATVKRAIQKHPEGNFYCHNETIRHPDGTETVMDYSTGFSVLKPVSRQLYERNRFSTSAVVCRLDLIRRWGGFDETLTSAQDYELWLRMSPELAPVFIPEVLGVYVFRKGNISTSQYWRRLVNILRVKHRHRGKGSAWLYAGAVLRVTASHLIAGVRNLY